MTKFFRMTLGCAAIILAAGLTGCGEKPAAPGHNISSDVVKSEAVFYLVRHAEKELVGDDPALSDAGYTRAQALAEVLKDVKLDAIYSTDTRRTRDTAAPTAANQNIEVTLYNGRALSEFARTLEDAKGNHLIVGHSNTTPQLAEALGGDGGAPIVEKTEYDRLYVLTRNNGVTVTQLRRFP